jgi:RNA recognition motif-containing protein
MNLYLGNLPFRVSEDEIRDLFSEFGEVTSVKLVSDRDTGRPKGFGFVEMSDQDGGQKAIAELDGKEYQGRALRVNEARPKEDNGGGFRPRRQQTNRW